MRVEIQEPRRAGNDPAGKGREPELLRFEVDLLGHLGAKTGHAGQVGQGHGLQQAVDAEEAEAGDVKPELEGRPGGTVVQGLRRREAVEEAPGADEAAGEVQGGAESDKLADGNAG